jgi:hypothetical protein
MHGFFDCIVIHPSPDKQIRDLPGVIDCEAHGRSRKPRYALAVHAEAFKVLMPSARLISLFHRLFPVISKPLEVNETYIPQHSSTFFSALSSGPVIEPRPEGTPIQVRSLATSRTTLLLPSSLLTKLSPARPTDAQAGQRTSSLTHASPRALEGGMTHLR